MAQEKWYWDALENLADLERQHDETEAALAGLNKQIADEIDRITHDGKVDAPMIEGAVRMIRAIGSPLDIDNPREPAAEAPTVDPLSIPKFLSRSEGSAEAAE